MAIYKMVGDKERLEEVAPSSFGQEGVLERSDLQRMLRDQPEVLEEGLLIIAEEYSNWQDSNRRIDLLALDAEGRLVVIELKRGDTGSHMDLQAIRYAAMVSTLTMQQAVVAHEAHLGRLGIEEDAEERLRLHLEEVELDDIYSAKPRIMLVSEGFSSELTTCALWLNDNGMDVTCIRIQPHRSGNELLVETSQMIPLPEAKNYLVKVQERERETRRNTRGRKGILVEGEDAFLKAIAESREHFRPGLNRLLDAAKAMKEENLVELYTHTNSSRNNIKLRLYLPGTDTYPVSFTNLLVNEGTGEINFWPECEAFSADSRARIDHMIGPATSRDGVRHRRLSTTATLSNLDEILATIRAAYREANGLPLGEDAAED